MDYKKGKSKINPIFLLGGQKKKKKKKKLYQLRFNVQKQLEVTKLIPLTQ